MQTVNGLSTKAEFSSNKSNYQIRNQIETDKTEKNFDLRNQFRRVGE